MSPSPSEVEILRAQPKAARAKAQPLNFYAPTLGDGLAGLESLEPGSVSLVLSDLPSGETAAKFDVQPDFERFWPAVWRVLKPTGCAVLFASSIRFASTVIASQPKAFRYDLVWEKSLATGFLNAPKRPLRAHEFVLVFSQGAATYNPQFLDTGVPIGTNGKGSHSSGSENYGSIPSASPAPTRTGKTDRFPRSVLRFGSVGTNSARRHPQQKPHDLLRNLVRQYSNRGDLVVDPYAGSGSSIEAARAEGRLAMGWDSSPRFGVPANGGSRAAV
jgi:site-specific DNA-methyltransferase (adenine-specific)